MHLFCSNVPFKRLFKDIFTIDQVTILCCIDSNPTAWSNTIKTRLLVQGFNMKSASPLDTLIQTILCHLVGSVSINNSK